MAELPTGTVTLLFTDIEGSTRLLHQLGDRYGDVLAAHQTLLRAAFRAHGGHEVSAQGDAFFVAFGRADDAVAAATEAQRALAAHPWPAGAAVRVRMGLHTGEPTRQGADYVGMDVHHGHRLMSAGHGGQVLLSQTAAELAKRQLPPGAGLRDLGEHRLKDLGERPERIFQLVVPGLAADFAPLRARGGRPHNLPAQLTPLVGRQKEVAAACEILRRDGVRLLTLSGTGGTGKTRLSLQVAAGLLDDHEDGVFFVPLAAIAEAGLVAPAIAAALGVEEAELRRRHARFFLALAEDAYPHLLGSALPHWIERLERDQDNLRAALAWLRDDDPATGLRLAVALARFWRVIGHDTELHGALGRALERGGGAPAEVRSVALREMGEVLNRITDFEQGDDALQQSAALSREAGDAKNLAWTLRKLAEPALWRRDHDRARAFIAESLTIERARGDGAGLAAALGYDAALARDTGDLEHARAGYEESAKLWRAAQNMANYAGALTHLAGLAHMQGDRARARGLQEESLSTLRRLKATDNLL